ncbi:hypothetical protein [Marinoscillum pacificum]|uniref:hypothetical protein n=1 Tax=Marinoscillum pacificum TaxID=392723 RepID=UPI0021578532|nr:hypothetical protein [Marinoscillum pacificum]
MELTRGLQFVAVLVIMCLSVAIAHAQVILSGGYTETFLSESAVDDASGFIMLVQKPIELSESGRLEFAPKVGLSVLNSRADEQFSPSLSTTLHFAPMFGYHIVNAQKLSIIPFAGPFGSWVNWLKGGDALARESSYVSEFRFGIEAGVAVDWAVSDKVKVRLIPYSVQFGNESFRQGNLTLGFEL